MSQEEIKIKCLELAKGNPTSTKDLIADAQAIYDFIKKGYDLEKEAFEGLAKQNQIAAFRHNGFWKSMNTLKDVIELNELYSKGSAPWTR